MAYIVGLTKSSTAPTTLDVSLRTLTGVPAISHVLHIMKLSITVILVAVSLSSKAFADLNLADYNPSPRLIGDTKFPRNDKILYRGTHEAQYHYTKAVRAMLSDPIAGLESPMFAVVREQLAGRRTSLFQKISGLQNEFYELGLQVLIDSRIRLNGGAFDEASAQRVAEEIMNRVYTSQFARTRIYDYTSSDRDDFPKAFLYSTVYVEVAKIYSPHIVIFKETRPRSLDANYWNKIQNGRWVHTNLSFPDRGEFITPFFIPSEDILGYQLGRKNYSTLWNVWRPLTADLGLVLMKKTDSKTPYVFVLDATGLEQVVEIKGQFCSAFTAFDPNQDLPMYTQPDCMNKPKVVSILRSCSEKQETNKTCVVPVSLFSSYEESPHSSFQIIENIKAYPLSNGDKIVSFTAKDAIQEARPTKRHKRSKP